MPGRWLDRFMAGLLVVIVVALVVFGVVAYR